MNGAPGKVITKLLPPQQKPVLKVEIEQPKIAIDDLDETFRCHLCKLMRSWLTNAQLPPSMVDTLYPLLSQLIPLWKEAQQDMTRTTTTESSFSSLYESIYIQTLAGFKTLKDSKFLPAVYHGEPLSNILSSNLGGARSEWLHHVVGGTIRIYGAPSGPGGDELLKIVAASVYTLWSLYLEMHVARDYHVKYQQQHKQDTAFIARGIMPQKRGGIMSWIWPKNSAKEPQVSLPNEKTEHSDSPPSPIPVADDPHRFTKLRKRLEHANVSSSPHCRFTAPRLLIRLQDEEDGIDTIRAVIRITNGRASKDSKPNTLKRRASSLLSLIGGNHGKEAATQQPQKKVVSSNQPVEVPQSISAYSSLRGMNDKKIGVDHLLLDTRSVDAFLQHQQISLSYSMYLIGCPQSPCVGPVLCKLSYFQYENGEDRPLGETISRWCMQAEQGITCKALVQAKLDHLSASGHSHDEKKNDKPSSNNNSNSSLPESSSASENEDHRRRSPFPSHGCQKPLTDHIMTFAHESAKVVVYISKDEALSPTGIAPSSDSSKTLTLPPQTNTIEAWLTCATCDATTPPTSMSVAAYHYSLAKYIELIFYHDTHFALLPCQHGNTRSSIVRCFRPSGTPFTVKMSYEQIMLYELRAPRLQVVPSSTKHDVKTTTTVVSLKTLKSWQKLIHEDVDGLFKSIDTHIDVLKQFIIAESKREARNSGSHSKPQREIQAQLVSRENELNEMKQLFGVIEYRDLLQELHRTPIESLNDYRRLFALRSTAILSQLSKWQQLWCSDLMDDCTWDPPDYIKSDKVHAFPGSSVLVREDEPSSMIAYTLSSSEYRAELRYQQQNELSYFATATPPSKPASSIASSASSTGDEYKKTQSGDGEEQSSRSNDGAYYSFIKRKYVAPNTGAASETASFRAMVIETVKANASELHYQQQRKLHELKERYGGSSQASRSSGLDTEDVKKTLQTTQRVMLDEPRIQGDVTAEVGASTFYEKTPITGKDKKGNKDKPLPPITPTSTGNDRRLSPHIKHKYIHNGVEFTCIVYYASEFENLRRQSGIDQLLIQSLSRCSAWKATGGKSKSHFYKSQDGRLVIKEMVNAWNNVEKESILKFAPKYFDYMKSTDETPSVLAKIFGFYTIRIRSVADKRVILNLDVLVMEHLFYGIVPQTIQKFDFKGIRDRHVEECRKQGDTTLWDGDWLQDYRLECPVSEQSKALIAKAIKSDTGFLTHGNIMDYSLLLGVDTAKKELTVGIVDFIGAYTWYKKVESRSKSTLNPHREVTVLPPDQYKWRFNRIVNDYFVAVSGKTKRRFSRKIRASSLKSFFFRQIRQGSVRPICLGGGVNSVASNIVYNGGGGAYLYNLKL
ncbi:hypothetical protein BJV82DRAFT_601784 [Fennellomyces sp. T-0311]|nr:hypothetical protein BJV82DRAFT_601784 [Fennellomyces sp. T-0311]